MNLVVMQPTLFPWLGYFDLYDQADVFVLLDDVQVERQSWQCRNRIVTERGLQWWSVPIARAGRGFEKIRDVEIARSNGWPDKHIKTLVQEYSKAPFFATLYPELSRIIRCHTKLSAMTEEIFRFMLDAIGLKETKLRPPAECSDRIGRLVDLCRKNHADVYLTTPGSEVYMTSDLSKFAEAGISVDVHMYEHPVYRQLHEPFVPYACGLDALFNLGPDMLDVIRSGRRPPRRIA